MNTKVKGYILGAVAAATYGMNPLFIKIVNDLFQPVEVIFSLFWFKNCPGKNSYWYSINVCFFKIFNVFLTFSTSFKLFLFEIIIRDMILQSNMYIQPIYVEIFA